METATRIEVLSGRSRRRRWTVGQKLEIVREASTPGVSVSSVAHRHDLHPNQVFRWRQQHRAGVLGSAAADGGASFVPVRVGAEAVFPGGPGGAGRGLMEIALGDGVCLRVDRDVDAAALRRVLSVLSGR